MKNNVLSNNNKHPPLNLNCLCFFFQKVGNLKMDHPIYLYVFVYMHLYIFGENVMCYYWNFPIARTTVKKYWQRNNKVGENVAYKIENYIEVRKWEVGLHHNNNKSSKNSLKSNNKIMLLTARTTSKNKSTHYNTKNWSLHICT